ncbi:MAG: hypothetical protein A3J69_00800 [Candidatus Levybacteria bacterium RIFCSPHIGHO2_02_FULL_42_12]|nr:MAG: hypothetical protein A2698_02140 [Candidatus Levybacteria bacterium RIFCSPHIGHO2_01_FULL_42_15]OGH33748.1 MAG: hypothetical protein A3J69_00800 [Candidatus Levybacteria bacterium RIFCSPHIGHO2_02_FULL_42_12]OGH43036.1 MAG: hypothetical protein A3B53_00515 [Candidatus Levybacteria bacterium RIFCSPLOWO2_01_FULL_42_15]
MKAPVSWIKEYVDTSLSVTKLAEKLSEVGIGVEAIETHENETVFDLEITPNRPDWYSIIGIAREVAALENKKILLTIPPIPKPKKTLPFTIHNNVELLEHYSGVLIDGVEPKESPAWLVKRLKQVRLRPINAIVDVTNYVMFELGIPLHAFDYDQIQGHEFFVEKARGGERFTTVDNATYTLPKDAIIIKDKNRIVDLVGIKGGLNSGISSKTKRILLQTSYDNPVLIRRASQALSLRSDASTILEKGVDKNGMMGALSRAVELILKTAGGEIASEVIDLKDELFAPWKLNVRSKRLDKILGIEISQKQVLSILENLNLSPKVIKDSIECTIPTYRNDLKIEEDLIEEVARHFGYNRFPLTLPAGTIPTIPIPYAKPYKMENIIKNLMKASGFSEIYTYSLVSEKDIEEHGINSEECLRIDNPVSREYEYLRLHLYPQLMKAFRQNKVVSKTIELFELGKVYSGRSIKEAKENYALCAISNAKSFLHMKGIFQRLYSDLGIKEEVTLDVVRITNQWVLIESVISPLFEKAIHHTSFKLIPQYPPIIEDIALVVPQSVKTGGIIEAIKKQSGLIEDVSLLDRFEDTRTFHIIYQSRERNLTTVEVSRIREKILSYLKKTLRTQLKERA